MTTDPQWTKEKFKPHRGVVNGVPIFWKEDHWEDVEGNRVELVTKHRGPICRECKCEFYYDFLEKPHPYESSGLCWECWVHQKGQGEMAKTGELGVPSIYVTLSDVTICGTTIPRPASIAPSQWLTFWNDVQQLGVRIVK